MNLTQAQLAKRYGLSQGTVSMCLRWFNVPSVGSVRMEGESRACRLYDEETAINAFKTHYREQADKLRAEAVQLDDRANSFRSIYEHAIMFNESV